MNPSTKTPWLVAGFLLCFLAGGFIFWRGSYQEYLDRGPPWQLLGIMAVVALLLCWTMGIRIKPCALVIGSSFPAVLMVRVILDCWNNPTDHNLWPFELVIATVLGMPVTFLSAGIGWLLRRVTTTQ